MSDGKALGEAVRDALAFVLVVMVLVWVISGFVGEWIRRRWGFFCKTCGHAHFGEAYRFACGGEGEGETYCLCTKVFP